jgi:hypothetical protein
MHALHVISMWKSEWVLTWCHQYLQYHHILSFHTRPISDNIGFVTRQPPNSNYSRGPYSIYLHMPLRGEKRHVPPSLDAGITISKWRSQLSKSDSARRGARKNISNHFFRIKCTWVESTTQHSILCSTAKDSMTVSLSTKPLRIAFHKQYHRVPHLI